MKVKIDNIIINDNRRKVDLEKVKSLAESLNEIGLLNPITINARYELIAGLHRLEAHKQLGIDEINAIILDLDDLHTELAEIDENLIRNELSPAEISISIAKRKRIYEEIYPETKRGIAGAIVTNNKNTTADSAVAEIDSFVDDTSKKTGLASRTISEYQQIGTTIPEDVLSQVDKDTTKQTLIEIAREVKQATKEKDKEIRELEKEYREIAKDDTMLLLEEEKRRADELERKLKEEREHREQIAKQEAERLLREKEEEKRRKKEEIFLQKKEAYKDRINNGGESIDIFNTDTKFRVIYADPCWSYEDKQDTYKLGGAEKHYSTMTIEQLCELPVKNITEDNAVLFLWVTSPLLEKCFEVIKYWGFKYKSSFVWDKIKHNMGHYNSVRHEFLLVCVKGSCTPDVNKLFDSVISIERSDVHSQKPKEFIEIIDTLYPFGNRLEMFARDKYNDNWCVWGNEV